MLTTRLVEGSVLLEPGGFLAWIIVGLLAGFFAGKVVRGRGLGCIGDVVVGLAGALIGGLVFRLLGLTASFGFLGSVLVAFIGAVLLLALVRMLTGRRR